MNKLILVKIFVAPIGLKREGQEATPTIRAQEKWETQIRIMNLIFCKQQAPVLTLFIQAKTKLSR